MNTLETLCSLDTISVAKKLLGMELLMNGKTLGIIVETEAYLGVKDAACHTYQAKRTPKNEAMYLAAGHWYVYQIYGHQMLNFVTRAAEVPEAVLIRALELPTNNGNGPGKFTRICGIDKRFNAENLAESSLTLAIARTPIAIQSHARIGVTCGEPWKSRPLGFYVAGHAQVSKIRKTEITNQPWQ